MKSSLQVTLLMALVVGAICGGAAWYYPWPDPTAGALAADQGLFAPFDASNVWSIGISRFDQEKQVAGGFVLQRRGERWLAPAFAGFPCDNIQLRTSLVNAVARLADPKTILETRSDEQEDHFKYGVVDPDELQQGVSRAGIGTRVTLEDRNRQTLASLIIGLPVEGALKEGQCFVRVPGQPQVYLAEFPAAVLSTDFRNWVDPNLFQLQTQLRRDGELPERFVFTSQPGATAEFTGSAPGPNAWRAAIAVQSGGLVLERIEMRAAAGWEPAVATPEAQQALQMSLTRTVEIPVEDVRSFSRPLVDNLINPAAVAGKKELYEELVSLGFRQVGAEGQPVRLESMGGSIEIGTVSGVRMTMQLGADYSEPKTRSKIARIAILRAQLDEARLPKPQPPVPADGAALTDEQQREYNRNVEAWQKSVESARTRVEAFNRRHGPWGYVIDENSVRRWFPVLPGLQPAPTTDSPTDEPADGSKPAETSQAGGESAATDAAMPSPAGEAEGGQPGAAEAAGDAKTGGEKSDAGPAGSEKTGGEKTGSEAPAAEGAGKAAAG